MPNKAVLRVCALIVIALHRQSCIVSNAEILTWQGDRYLVLFKCHADHPDVLDSDSLLHQKHATSLGILKQLPFVSLPPIQPTSVPAYCIGDARCHGA